VEEAITTIQSWTGQGGWVVQAFVVVFGVLLLNFLQRRSLNRLHKTLLKTPNPWDDSLVAALQRPLTFLVWIVGLSFAAHIVGQETGASIFDLVDPVRDVGVIGCLAWFLVRLIEGVKTGIMGRAKAGEGEVDEHLVESVSRLLRASVWITATLVALQTLGFSISGVLAFGGVGGVAVGFAAKDLLANFFGGLMIYLDRPFKVGDWIRSPDREIEGTVEKIGWRLTCIRSFDKRPIYVPNSMFANIAVVNPSRMSHRRIHETIGIRYQDAAKMPAIVTDVKAMLREHPEIDNSQTLIVNFNHFAPSSLDFFIYAYTRTTNWVKYHEVKQDVLLKVLAIIEGHGAEAAFPTSTVHVPEGISLIGGPDTGA